MHTVTLTMTPYEIRVLKYAGRTGRLDADFTFTGDQVTFKTLNRKRLASQLERVIVFDATSAHEVIFGHGPL